MNEVTKIDGTALTPAADVWGAPAALQAQTPMDMLSIAVSRGASIEELGMLMALAERQEANQARRAFDAAIAQAKAEIPTIVKNRTVDFTSAKGRTHYRYEDLAEIARTIDPILAKNGLHYRFRTHNPPNELITVTCVIAHRDGHFEENSLSGARDESGSKNGHQAIQSAVTYLERCTLKASLGLAASNEDDDGRAAGAKPDEDGNGGITDKQVTDLVDLIDHYGAETSGILKFFGVTQLAELSVSDLRKATAMLDQKYNRGAKK